MPKFKVEGLEIRKMLKIARKQPISFAYNPGKGGKDQYLGFDRRQPPKLLGQEAKSEGDGVKFAFGAAELDGKTLCLTCTKVVPAIAKVLKKYLRAQKVPFNVQIMDGNGNVLESDISDDIPDDPDMQNDGAKAGADTSAVQPPPDQSKSAKDVRTPTNEAGGTSKFEPGKTEEQPANDGKQMDIKAVKQKLAELKAEILKLPEESRNKQIAALGAVMGAIKLGKLDLAIAAVATISEAVEKAKSAPKPPPSEKPGDPNDATPKNDDTARARLKEMFAALRDNHVSFQIRGDKSLTAKAQLLYDGFGATIDTDLKKAAAIFLTLKKFLAAQLVNLPEPSAAEKTIADATGQPVPAARYKQATEIMTKYPAASSAARDAMDGFADLLGDQEPTPELLEEAKADIAQAKARKSEAEDRLVQAKAMGDGPNKAKAIRLAQADVDGLQARIDETEAFEKAARGKKALSEALAFGPLSGNSKQAFSDEAAKALIEGFTRAPDLATVALEAAETGKYPDAVAKGLAKVIDHRDMGFKAEADDFVPDPEVIDEYAANLLKMGANVGPEFFGRMDDYIASGRQFVENPIGDLLLDNKTAKAQLRSTVLGGALLQDGHLDLGSQAAKDAIGDLLFNPFSLKSPMPAMNEHVVKTLEFLGDDANKGIADTILAEMSEPESKASQKLIRTALRKPELTEVSKEDAQTAVMASMLKPLHQGKVGSCFSTAPVRRLRETDPLAAMDVYATIAGTGMYKPPFGPEVSATSDVPDNEDPVMRNWEYALATSAARVKGSYRSRRFDAAMRNATEEFSDKVTDLIASKAAKKGGATGFFGSLKEKLTGLFKGDYLATAVSEAFHFTYDATAVIPGASDGNSEAGRYILVRKSNGHEIKDKAAFVREIADVAIDYAEFAHDSDEADEIRAYVGSDAFIDKVTPVTNKDQNGGEIKYLPWQQTAGGIGRATNRALFSEGMEIEKFTEEYKGIVSLGDRTEELLEKMLTTFEGAPEEMIMIEVVSMHGFNALPNDSSLDKLKGKDKDETAQKVKTHLLDVGEELKVSSLDAGKAGYMFDKQIAVERAKIERIKADTPEGLRQQEEHLRMLEKGAKDHRPTGDLSPAELSDAVANAVKEYIEDMAQGFSKPDKAAAFFKGQAVAGVKTEILRDFGVEEFVIADTNWGSAEHHIFFVIAPDPATGEPQLWKKTVPPGSLSPVEDRWVEANWASVQ